METNGFTSPLKPSLGRCKNGSRQGLTSITGIFFSADSAAAKNPPRLVPTISLICLSAIIFCSLSSMISGDCESLSIAGAVISLQPFFVMPCKQHYADFRHIRGCFNIFTIYRSFCLYQITYIILILQIIPQVPKVLTLLFLYIDSICHLIFEYFSNTQ